MAAVCRASGEESGLKTERLADFKLRATIDLKGETHHVQGLVTDGNRAWVTSVDRVARAGRIQIFDLPSGQMVRSKDIQEGDLFHPGGCSMDGKTIWIPLATYTREGPAVIQQRDADSLELISSFPVGDHIGCLAVNGDQLIGGNWDARKLYFWDRTGKLLMARNNPTGIAIQDFKVKSGHLICSGQTKGREDRIDWIDLASYTIDRRILGGPTDRGAGFMREGMDLLPGALYLLPEDQPSRLFIFDLP